MKKENDFVVRGNLTGKLHKIKVDYKFPQVTHFDVSDPACQMKPQLIETACRKCGCFFSGSSCCCPDCKEDKK